MALANMKKLSEELGYNKAGWSRWIRMARDYLIDEAKSSFDKQGTYGFPWPPRSVPNVAGIIEDAKRGSTTIQPNRLTERPAGINTGALKESITGRVDGTKIVLESKLPYAAKFFGGGASVFDISKQTAQNIATAIQNSGIKSRGLARAARGGVLIIMVPARRMFAMSPENRAAIRDMAIQVSKEVRA